MTGEERLHGRGELPGQRPDRVGPPGHQHQHDRFPGGDQSLALRTALDIFADRSVVPAPGHARRPPRPRGP
jgi:hypothetical protein